MTPKQELENLERIGKHNREITKNWLEQINYEKLKELNEYIDNIYEAISELKEYKVYNFMAEALEKVLEANMEVLEGTEIEFENRQLDRKDRGLEI